MKEVESTTNHILKIWLPKLSKAAPVIDLTVNFREGFAQESQGAPGKVLMFTDRPAASMHSTAEQRAITP